jgi:integrase
VGYAEKRGDYWRGRYKIAPGNYGTIKDARGGTIRFRTKRDAERAADDAEAKIRAEGWRDPTAGQMKFGDYVNDWYQRQDLASSTMQNYRRHIEDHLLPAFETYALVEITAPEVDKWQKRERTAGYAESSIRSWRATLHLIMADAIDEGLIPTNPATKRRGRGKRAGRSHKRGPEKKITTALGILLIAERAALLSGRDDEFVAVVTDGFTGIRWGETVGLETTYVRPGKIRVEWQLYELDTGELHRCPPKDDSHRTVHVPDWLSTLVADHIARTRPAPCRCHGKRYVFSGHRSTKSPARQPTIKLADVAQRAGVSIGTASMVLNHPESIREAKRAAVRAAIADLGYVRGAVAGELSAHWRRSGFATWLFQPAVTGWYPSKGRLKPRPVPVLAEPWPGVPVRGRNAAGRADSCWVPIMRGLTPHGLRHTYKTLMLELGTPSVLMDSQMGHSDGSVQAMYSHITPEMVRRLLDGLTEMWIGALKARRAMNRRSPVTVLDRLLTEPDER